MSPYKPCLDLILAHTCILTFRRDPPPDATVREARGTKIRKYSGASPWVMFGLGCGHTTLQAAGQPLEALPSAAGRGDGRLAEVASYAPGPPDEPAKPSSQNTNVMKMT